MKLPRHALDRKFRLARRWSNDELRRVAPHFSGQIVNVSGWRDEDKEGGTYRSYFSCAASYDVTNWHGQSGFQGTEGEIVLDLTEPLPDELRARFDVVFNHTTLEHIFDVMTAFENLCTLSRDVVILVVPFAQVQHENDSFKDYWRFTPSWVREAFRRQGLETLYVSSNDDPNAAVYVFAVGSRHPERWRDKMPGGGEHPRMAARWIGRSLWRSALNLATSRRSGPGE